MSFRYEIYIGESADYSPKLSYSSGSEREKAILGKLETAMSDIVSSFKGYVSISCSGHLADYDDMPGDDINFQVSTLLRPSDPTPDAGVAAAAGSARSFPPEASTAAPMTEDASPPAAQDPVPQPFVPYVTSTSGNITFSTASPLASGMITFSQPSPEQPLSGDTEPAPSTETSPSVAASPPAVPPAQEQPTAQAPPPNEYVQAAQGAPVVEPAPDPSVAAPTGVPVEVPSVFVDEEQPPFPPAAANSPEQNPPVAPDPMPEAPLDPPPAQ